MAMDAYDAYDADDADDTDVARHMRVAMAAVMHATNHAGTPMAVASGQCNFCSPWAPATVGAINLTLSQEDTGGPCIAFAQ